jgi:streptogramin lyase
VNLRRLVAWTIFCAAIASHPAPTVGYIHSLFIDHSGTLWVGCEEFLDKFDPITETFTHFRIDTPTTVITEDHAGKIGVDDSGYEMPVDWTNSIAKQER